MAHKEVEDAVEKLLEPILEADGIEVVDVEYVRERNWILRIFIDKEGGVDLNDCQGISEKAGAILDEKVLIPDNYMLEVSSPGLDRVLKKDKDFIRYTGEEVDVKLFAPLEGHKGVKAFTALLDGLSEDGSLKLTLEGGESIVLGRDKISQVRLHFSF
ncbi:ribosome maturation factor RimP [Dialister hominis]|uniref:ribosome maturation factor RimP n=1 Tax=Dialister hominis TaxID=2582419 RepID=UPI003AF994F8